MNSRARPPFSTLLPSAVLLALTLPLAALAAAPKKAPPPLRPAATIPLQPLGFEPPSLFYLAQRPSSLTLNFIDANHLLFTFRVNTLIQRNPNNIQPGDQDQVIQADVLDISTGKVLKTARWTMHDHQHYLWPLGHGKFLIRVGNNLFHTDSSLTLQPFLQPRHPLTFISVSAGRRYLYVETEVPADPASLAPEVDLQGRVLQQPQHVNLAVYQAANLKLLFRSRIPRAFNLPVMLDGFLELRSVKPKKGHGHLWLIREVQFQGLADRAHLPARLPIKNILTFHSDCRPSLLPLSSSAVLTGCAGDGADHMMTAVDLAGKKLWQQWWQARYVWHTMAYAANGSRFALGSLMTDQPLLFLNQANINDVKSQIVGVFDTTTGKLVLVRNAHPMVSAGQNFALSANGRRFAILRNQAIEIYNLPANSNAPPTAAIASK